MRFPIVIHKDNDTDFGVIVPDLPGCYSAGSTYEEAVNLAKEAIECHIEGLLLDNESIPLLQSMLDEHMANPEYKGGVWAFVDIELSEVGGKAVRVNITLPDKVLSLVDLYVKNHLKKNRSAFLTDAALSYIAASETASNEPSGDRQRKHP